MRVEALPNDLPHHIELDISMIKTLDDGIFVRDINLGTKVVILDDADLAVVAAVALEEDTGDSVTTPIAEPTA